MRILNILLFSALFISTGVNRLRAQARKITLSKEIVVLDSKETPLNVSSVLGGKERLFYRIKPIYCGPCIDRELLLLSKLSKQLPANSIVILTAFSDFRSYLSFAKGNDTSMSYYNVSSLHTVYDKSVSEGSYYFRLDKDYVLKDVFFSDKQSIKSSEKNLIKMAEVLFQITPLL